MDDRLRRDGRFLEGDALLRTVMMAGLFLGALGRVDAMGRFSLDQDHQEQVIAIQ